MFRGLASGVCLAFLSLVALGALGQAASLPPETIAARQHYFGLDNVDPQTGAVRTDRVILSWTGVSSFAAALKGHVVLLDAYIARQGGVGKGKQHAVWPGMAYVGTTPEELAALKPELVLIGHTHYDHAGDLPVVIRANPGLVVAGTAEHCADFKQDITDAKFTCISAIEAGAAMGSSKVFQDLLPGVIITAIRQPHSWPPKDPAEPSFVFPPKPETCPVYDEFPGTGDPLAWKAPEVGPPSGLIAVAWQIRIGDFALMWQDSAGTIAGTGVVDAFAHLAPTDVRVGAIAVSPKTVVNEHLLALKPRLFIPIHHDPCAYNVREELEKQIATLPREARPALWFLEDPGDYLRPISFDPTAKIWKDR